MYFITVNGKEYVTAHDKALITFLRDELNLTAAKDASDADTVLVDGEKVSARSVRLSALTGKTVTTMEGGAEGLESPLFTPGVVYADDVNVPRQVYVRPLFAEKPGATLTGIDISQALENVRFGDCLQKADIPGDFDGIIGIGDTVKSTGDVVALVVTTYLAEMEALCRSIKIEYNHETPTPPAKRNTPPLPESATAIYRDDDTLTIHTNSDDPEGIRTLCAKALDIPEQQITCVSTPVSGASCGRAEVFAALTAWITQQSAKVKF